MEKNDNSNGEITFKMLNEKLTKIENKIDKINTEIKIPKSFLSSFLIAFGLVLISIALSFNLTLGGYSEGVIRSTIISYFIIGIGLIVFGLLFIRKKDKK